MKTIVVLVVSNVERTKFPSLLRSMEIFTDDIKSRSPHSIYAKQQAISAQIIYTLLAVSEVIFIRDKALQP